MFKRNPNHKMNYVPKRLTPEQIEAVRLWMDSAPQDKKPSIRTIAKRLGVSRLVVIKSLGGWKGIARGAPQVIKTPHVIDRNISSPVTIEPYQVDVPEDLKNAKR